jgi:pantoate--beta-alanine ligase
VSGYLIALQYYTFPFSLIGLVLGLFLSIFVIHTEQAIRKLSLKVIFGGVVGTVIGLLIAFLFTCGLKFMPGLEELYPRGQAAQTRIEVPGLSDILCGASRPGHFIGVATVVCKLLNMVQPHLALFGEKDYQQLLVIRRMVEDLAMPVEIAGMATVREADGLAMSSRNGYLSSAQRAQAPQLYRILQQLAQAIVDGRSDYSILEQQARAELSAEGLGPDYVSVRRAEDLALPEPGDRQLRILAAAYLGQARLIDNLPVGVPD